MVGVDGASAFADMAGLLAGLLTLSAATTVALITFGGSVALAGWALHGRDNVGDGARIGRPEA